MTEHQYALFYWRMTLKAAITWRARIDALRAISRLNREFRNQKPKPGGGGGV